MTIEQPPVIATSSVAETPGYFALPASRYDYTELAEIYNQSRVDYIVPMPMNAKRMEAYVTGYDVDLDASVVVFDRSGEMAGVGMLGVRGERAWVTRVGVLPNRRGNNLGRFLMDALIDNARERGCRLVQLEVIKNNTPAHRLFLKLGFRETRELLIIRRPPGKSTLTPPDSTMTPLTAEETKSCATQCGAAASWIEEPAALLQVKGLKGIRVTLATGETGWAIYEFAPLQIAHIVLNTPAHVRDEMTRALLHHLHSLHPMQDTKVENTPALDLRWPAYQQMGYVEAFRRIEMFLYL